MISSSYISSKKMDSINHPLSEDKALATLHPKMDGINHPNVDA